MGLKNEARKVRRMLSKEEGIQYQMACPFCGTLFNITKNERPSMSIYDSITGTEIYEATCEDCHITYSSEFIGCLKPIERKRKY